MLVYNTMLIKFLLCIQPFLLDWACGQFSAIQSEKLCVSLSVHACLYVCAHVCMCRPEDNDGYQIFSLFIFIFKYTVSP